MAQPQPPQIPAWSVQSWVTYDETVPLECPHTPYHSVLISGPWAGGGTRPDQNVSYNGLEEAEPF